MLNLANRLMRVQTAASGALPTAIFGAGSAAMKELEINKPALRIGLWPVISHEQPETAMGILALIGLLLERYNSTRVYRIFVMLEGEPVDFKWDIQKSQFEVDDWQVNDLDENVALWGTLIFDNGYRLMLEVEYDIHEDVRAFTLHGSSLTELITALPGFVDEIAQYLEAVQPDTITPIFPALTTADEILLKDVLHAAFHWERKLFLSLWGTPWDESEWQADKLALESAGQQAGEFGAWVTAASFAHTILMGSDEDVTALFLPGIDSLIASFPESYLPALILARAVFRIRQLQPAYDLLEAAVENYPDVALLHLALAELYRSGGRLQDAVETFQAAIDDNVTDALLFSRYADLLAVLDYSGIRLADYLLIDPDDFENPMAAEAIYAYQQSLVQNPDQPGILSAQLLLLLDMNAESEIHKSFEQLLRYDKSGNHIRQVAEAFYDYGSAHLVIDSLSNATRNNSERLDLQVSLAVIYLAAEEPEKAETVLRQARQSTSEPEILADIDRLLLSAEDPEFEMRLGEITDIVNAGSPADTEDVEFLESIIERVPTFEEAYILAAKAYLRWDEPGTAIETLLDGHRHLPHDPDIAFLLAESLWDTGEEELAFNYLNRGIRSNPNYVPLLALMGKFLFEDDQLDLARQYLARADAISPRDPVLAQVRLHISRTSN